MCQDFAWNPVNLAVAKRARSGGLKVTVAEVVAVRAALIEVAGRAAEPGALGEFDPEGWGLLLRIRADRVMAIVAALEAKAIIVDDRLAGWVTNGDVAASRRAMTGAERTARWRMRQRGDAQPVDPVECDEKPSRPVTPSPAAPLEEERNTNIDISSLFGPANGVERPAAEIKRERWLDNMLGEARHVFAPDRLARLLEALPERDITGFVRRKTPLSRHARAELEGLDQRVKAIRAAQAEAAASQAARAQPGLMMPIAGGGGMAGEAVGDARPEPSAGSYRPAGNNMQRCAESLARMAAAGLMRETG